MKISVGASCLLCFPDGMPTFSWGVQTLVLAPVLHAISSRKSAYSNGLIYYPIKSDLYMANFSESNFENKVGELCHILKGKYETSMYIHVCNSSVLCAIVLFNK